MNTKFIPCMNNMRILDFWYFNNFNSYDGIEGNWILKNVLELRSPVDLLLENGTLVPEHVRGWMEKSRQFLNYAVTGIEESWCIAQYWQCLLKSSAMCNTALCLLSSGSNEGENLDSPLQDCTIEEQRGVPRFLWAEGLKPVEIHRRMLAQYG